jgi:pimeloyl-ACP methyl ester carboxylesterase
LILQAHDDGFFVRSRGGGAANVVLYIHGLGESGLCFERLMEEARLDGWTHLCPDLLGYGKSPWAAEPLSLEDHARELARWLEGRRLDGPVVLLGHSMGGVVGLLLCEQRPDLVRAFLNVEGNISLDDCTFSSRAAAVEPEEFRARGMARLIGAIHADSFGSGQRALRDYFVSLRICDPRAFHKNSVELVTLSRGRHPRSGPQGRDDPQLAARLAGLPMEAHYILGDPRGTGPRSRALLEAAGVPVSVVPDAGHWPFVDRQPLFVDRMVEFLEAL